jgi:hypothetical protein
MMLTFLIIHMSGTWYDHKLHWLVLAYALASASHFLARRSGGKPGISAVGARGARTLGPNGH